MKQLPLTQLHSWTVTEVNRYLRDLIESDHNLQDIWVQGEVSNISLPRSGHMYFTIKDGNASLRCVMWRSQVQYLKYIPKDGDAIDVHGYIGIYEQAGQYQLYAKSIKPLGEGALYQEFLRVKAELEAAGYFEEDRKRPIPRWPHTIGVVTSATGAAIRDILDTLFRRYPLAGVVIVPSSVQGEVAPAEIAAGIENLNKIIHPDVIIVSRGGGSIEDLWAFNDPQVAEAIFHSEAPIITGIGHQTDFTIADFVADLRAPTPTAAAELAVPNRDDLKTILDDLQQRLTQNTITLIQNNRWVLGDQTGRLHRNSPDYQIRSNRQHLDEFHQRLAYASRHNLSIHKERLHSLELRLNGLNPSGILQRGYSIVTTPEKKIIRSVGQVNHGDPLRIRVSDGEFDAQVTGKQE